MPDETSQNQEFGRVSFVSHPLFEESDALEKLDRLKPADWQDDEDAFRSLPEFSPPGTPMGRLCERPQLTRDEERYAFLRMNFERFTANLAAEREPYLARSLALRNRILLANSRLLVSIAGQFASETLRCEDLVSEGVLPLMRAVELFDVSRGWAFGTYATHTLRNHFRRLGKRRDRRNRLAIPAKDAQLANIPDEGVPLGCQHNLAVRHQQMVQRCLAELPDTDQDIMRARFGFDHLSLPKTRSYEEVGRMVGLSKERVRVRTHRALAQLRETARERRWEYPEYDGSQLFA